MNLTSYPAGNSHYDRVKSLLLAIQVINQPDQTLFT